ncbi:zinc ABC transporter substrate-binding protein [Roseobacter sp. S98]|uniref:zinc ABC transporter substrate-binding protein n=1 Tax=Roseobacter algicola (ex Choi et al. 2025) (nom. illeg.) TaxID=3092138 RepID=UPI0035C7889F
MMRFSVLTAGGLMIAGAAYAEAPRVVTDIAPVHSLVAQVMAGAGSPDLLVPPGASPHAYAMRPSEARALSQADVVFWIGPELTPWLEGPVETLAGDARHVSLTEAPGMVLLEFREGENFEAHDHAHDEHSGEKHDDHGHEDHDGDHAAEKHDDHDHDAHDDHAHDEHDDHDKHHDEAEGHDHDEHDHDKEHKEAGHDDHDDHGDEHAGHEGHAHHGSTDPHLWLDPANAQAWLTHISAILSEQDPENADLYAENARKAAVELTAQQAAISEQLAPFADKPFVVTHDAYHYFEARFGVTAVGAITLADDGPASAGHLAEVRETVERTGATCALNDPASGEGLIDALTTDGALRIATASPTGAGFEPGPAFYPDMLQNIADALTDCLGSS